VNKAALILLYLSIYIEDNEFMLITSLALTLQESCEPSFFPVLGLLFSVVRNLAVVVLNILAY
jgi:hypothetical protein